MNKLIVTDRLKIEEAERLRDIYIKMNPNSDTCAQFVQAYAQLADTMRENERLRNGLIEVHRLTFEGFIETSIEDVLSMEKDDIKKLYPSKDSDNG